MRIPDTMTFEDFKRRADTVREEEVKTLARTIAINVIQHIAMEESVEDTLSWLPMYSLKMASGLIKFYDEYDEGKDQN